MKKITQSIFLLICSIGFSQNAPINFETGGFGATWNFTMFENATNPALEIVSNPSSSGINTSATVAKFTALQAGQPWAGCESQHNAAIGTFNLTAANCVVKMMVYKTVISDVGIKFATAGGDSTGEIKVANTLVNQWEELTFNFAGKIGEPSSTGIDQIIIFPDFNARTSDHVIYFDNITFSTGTVSNADPLVGAPNPIIPSTDVISMFSNVYTNIPVTTWRTDWSDATLEEVQVLGNDTKKYTGLSFAGIEPAAQMNITGMTHFNITVWSPNFSVFKVKLVDFGANAVYQGGDDSEHEITYNSPAQNQWVTYHIPLSAFTGLTGREHIAQLIISSSNAKVYVDNVFFNTETIIEPVTDPIVAAPDPVLPQTDVMSMFSNVYTNVPVATWRTEWSDATLAEVQVAGNDTKKYTALNFVGIETTTPQMNVSAMTHFNLSVWSPDFTEFRIKLVDFGANGVYQGGDDSEHELVFAAPAQSEWVTYHIPLSNFTGLLSKEHITQLIFASNGAKVYVDNVYFSNEALPLSDPITAAPDPTQLQANVISMFSNSYTNVPVDTWKTEWSSATLEEVQVTGNDTKKYTNLSFVGIETVTSQINATNMTFFNVNVWSPDFTVFKVKLVDFGPNGIFQGGDDTEHEVTFNAPAQSQWITYHIPLSEFENLTSRANIAQLIFVGGGGKVYVDNVYFSNESVVPPVTDPVVAAPNPTLPSNQVISMFSNAYTNVAVDTWRTSWSDATLAEVQIAGDDVKKYTGLNFVGIETVASQLDITNMTHFNVDVWSPNFSVFKIKLVDFGVNGIFQGGDDTEHEITFNAPALNQWVTYHIPISNFTNLANKHNIAQLIFVGGGGKVYVDNVYFSTDTPLGIPENVVTKIKMYPNPASGILNISATQAIQEIAIFNTIGQQVKRIQPDSAEISLNIDSLAKGIYFVSSTINGKTTTNKLVVQ